jgi:hypothetical protein
MGRDPSDDVILSRAAEVGRVSPSVSSQSRRDDRALAQRSAAALERLNRVLPPAGSFPCPFV